MMPDSLDRVFWQNRRPLPVLFLLGVLSIGSSATSRGGQTETADDLLISQGWELSHTEGELTIYSRKLEEGEGRELLARKPVPHPDWRLWSVLNDYEHFPDFMPYVETAEVIREEPGVVYMFQVFDLPWPVGNRCFTIRVELHLPKAAGDGYARKWDLAPEEHGEKDCGVTPRVNRGSWTLKPISPQAPNENKTSATGVQTMVTYHIVSDPGGKLPRFAVRSANKKAIPRLFKAIESRAALPRYDAPTASE